MTPAPNIPYAAGDYGNPGKDVVLITAKVHTWLIDTLATNHHVWYRPAITPQELLAIAPHLKGLVITTRLTIGKQFLDNALQLGWIGRLGSGLELIDTAYAATKGIKVVSSPEGNANAVGEHCLGLLLAVLNRIAFSHAQVKQGLWQRDENRGTELKNRVVGIIGYGHTGSAFAKLLQPFGVTVLAYDKYKAGFGGGYIKEASLEQVQRYAEVISFHVPLTEETRYMANAAFFRQLQQQPVILNTSRGKVVSLEALQHALLDGQICGAGLDVLENEKPDTWNPAEKALVEWLGNHPGVVLTPHIAGYSHEALLLMAQVMYQKIFG